MRKLSRIDVKKTLDKVDTSVENEGVNGYLEERETASLEHSQLRPQRGHSILVSLWIFSSPVLFKKSW